MTTNSTLPRTESRLFTELQMALSKTNADDLKAWGKSSAVRLPVIGKRRLKNLGSLVTSVADAVGSELRKAMLAWQRGDFGKHLEQRTAAGIDSTIDMGRRTWTVVGTIGRALIDDPKKNAPGVLALSLGFLAGSGGVDGNGGIPDTDIAMFGIGDHRSLFTHSIIAGIVVEGSILALADLAGIVCNKLPAGERDPFWDTISSTKDLIAEKLAIGASAGIAYHLAVDATLQPAAYKDLPFSMPMEAHQTLFALNAAAEGVDAAKRQTTGERITGTVSRGLASIMDNLKATGNTLKTNYDGNKDNARTGVLDSFRASYELGRQQQLLKNEIRLRNAARSALIRIRFAQGKSVEVTEQEVEEFMSATKIRVNTS